MKQTFRKRLTKLWRDRAGGVFVYAAIAAPVMIGAAGLSVDIGLWYANKSSRRSIPRRSPARWNIGARMALPPRS